MIASHSPSDGVPNEMLAAASQPPVPRTGPRYRWALTPRATAEELRAYGELDPLLAQLLRNRDLLDTDAAQSFLNADRQPLADPYLMAGLPAAVARLERAIDADELIAVYGDYDVDGLSATALLCTAFKRLRARVLPFIPHREKDGYGLQDGPLADLRAAGASLVVTVDCGVTAAREIATARAAGLEVIVTDHHPVPPELPAAAVLNPNRGDCPYPFKELAGVGVAFRLAEGLLRRRLPAAEVEPLLDHLLEFVALGTLADCVALRGENRTIVRRGLAALNATRHPGLAALIASAGIEAGCVDADRVAFALAPRLNAAGRLDHARRALDLLLCPSSEQAGPLADRLNELNRERQAQTAAALEQARAQLAGRALGPGIVLAGDFPLGIVGLLAGRLVEDFDCPAIVLRLDGETCRGSARSVVGLNVVEAMRAGANYLDRFGGHAMAAGLSLPTQNLARFEQLFVEAVGAVRPRPAGPGERLVNIDAELRPSTALRWATLELLPRLEPFGAGNPAPLFLTRDLRVIDRREVGEDHLKLRLAADNAQLAAIAFRAADATLAVGDRIDLVYHLRRNLWRGTIQPELEVIDWRPSQACA